MEGFWFGVIFYILHACILDVLTKARVEKDNKKSGEYGLDLSNLLLSWVDVVEFMWMVLCNSVQTVQGHWCLNFVCFSNTSALNICTNFKQSNFIIKSLYSFRVQNMYSLDLLLFSFCVQDFYAFLYFLLRPSYKNICVHVKSRELIWDGGCICCNVSVLCMCSRCNVMERSIRKQLCHWIIFTTVWLHRNEHVAHLFACNMRAMDLSLTMDFCFVFSILPSVFIPFSCMCCEKILE